MTTRAPARPAGDRVRHHPAQDQRGHAGDREVEALEVFDRIADGLHMPDPARVALGLAPKAVTHEHRWSPAYRYPVTGYPRGLACLPLFPVCSAQI